MFFYVDESGHTGSELFDESQPILYYGVVSSDLNLDLLAETYLVPLRKKLDVERLHAAQLGVRKLASIAKELNAVQKKFGLYFDFYRINKPDHAVICFFDQVFDSAMNPTVPWSSYWTPMRYVYLLKLATLFEEEEAKLAWSARTDTDRVRASASLVAVCQRLSQRIDRLVDARSKQVIGDALAWVVLHPDSINYNVNSRDEIKQISPNIIGFQFVMHGIARRILKRRKGASRIIVDRQSEFNQAQKTLVEFFAAAAGMRGVSGPDMPEINFAGMPNIPVEFMAGSDSAGLEIVDVYLWIFKRILEGREMASELMPLFYAQRVRGFTDEVSLASISARWEPYFSEAPRLDDISAEHLEFARDFMRAEEKQRQAAVLGRVTL